MRRGILCAALAALVNTSAVYATPAPPAPATVWVAEKVSPNAPRLTLEASTAWDRRSGRITYVAVKLVAGKPRPVDALTLDAPQTDGPAAYHRGTAYGCYAGSGCDVGSGPGFTSFVLTFPEDIPQPDRLYLAVSGVSAEVWLVDSPGWRLKRTSLRVRYATSDTSGDAVGGQVAGEHVERFQRASIPGGRRGSIAVGTPPCRPLHRVGYFREGYGTATLSGGAKPVPFDCQRAIGDATAAADRATTWTLEGDVTGVATGTTRLTVIDL